MAMDARAGEVTNQHTSTILRLRHADKASPCHLISVQMTTVPQAALMTFNSIGVSLALR